MFMLIFSKISSASNACRLRTLVIRMSSQLYRPVVSTEWLNKELKDRKGGLAVLDVTWFSDKDACSGFSKQHIMHASYMDMFFGVENTALLPRNIPDATTFQMNARGSAVNNGDHVVIYENVGRFGFSMGARAWWTFKEGDFTAKFNPKWMRKFEDMEENVKSQKHKSQDWPLAWCSEHSIPSLFNPDTKILKTVDELKKVYADVGIDLSKPVITMCGSGMSSCTLVLAAHVCGCPDVALYPGGFNEWRGKVDPSQIE
ncbi:hypothetical protein OS493_035048 [Desmophyllum pertusum]|uniref:Sulfurtransferase n=1 Tax=Desmophyllum pertusum TaxID=174260 RepID=A0A9X0D716_9CNID|nr:hypothetical protein OS493_035048 [Desmophyllum pertusum]